MSEASVTLDEAVDLARTGDLWLFRGHTMADRAIQVATNSPVNHVGMSVAIEDLPPLMWHARGNRGPVADPETAYCAQLLAATYQAMGLLPGGRRPSRYDPGSFWSGDNLSLSAGFRLGGEIAVHIPAGELGMPHTPAASR